MAEIDPVNSKLGPGVELVTWTTLTESDTAEGYLAGSTKPLVGALQVTGTFGGATVSLQGSNDNSNWVNLKDTAGTEIALTAAGGADFSTAFAYIRVSASGGSSQDVDSIICLRE